MAQHFECCTFDHSDNSPSLDSLYSITVLCRDCNPVPNKKRETNSSPVFLIIVLCGTVVLCIGLIEVVDQCKNSANDSNNHQGPRKKFSKSTHTNPTPFLNNLQLQNHQRIPAKKPESCCVPGTNNQNVLLFHLSG